MPKKKPTKVLFILFLGFILALGYGGGELRYQFGVRGVEKERDTLSRERDELKQEKRKLQVELGAANETKTEAEQIAAAAKVAETKAMGDLAPTKIQLETITKVLEDTKAAKKASDEEALAANTRATAAMVSEKKAKDDLAPTKTQLEVTTKALEDTNAAKKASDEKALAANTKATAAEAAEKKALAMLKPLEANLKKTSQSLEEAEAAQASAIKERDTARQVVREARRKQALSVLVDLLGEPSDDLLVLVEQELKDVVGSSPREQVSLHLAQARLLLQAAGRLHREGKREECSASLEKAAASAEVAAKLARETKVDLEGAALYQRGSALESLERYDDALAAFEAAGALARTEGEKDQCVSACSRIKTSKALRKETGPAGKSSRLNPAHSSPPLVLLSWVGRSSLVIVSEADAEPDEGADASIRQQLLRVQGEIDKLGKKAPPDLYLHKAKLQLRLRQHDQAIKAALAGEDALVSREPPQLPGLPNVPRDLLKVLASAERDRQRTPAEIRAQSLETENAVLQGKLAKTEITLKQVSKRLEEVQKERDTAKADQKTAERERDDAKIAEKTCHKEKSELNIKLNTCMNEVKVVGRKLWDTEDQLTRSKELLKKSEESLYRITGKLADAVKELSAVRSLTPLSKRAFLVVQVPEDAALYINDKLHSPKGTKTRDFITPRLEPGQTFNYVLKVERMQDGKKTVTTRTARVRAGMEVRVSILTKKGEASEESVTAPLEGRALLVAEVPDGAQLYVGKDLYIGKEGTIREFITPRLNPGQTYSYELRVIGTEDGSPVRLTRRVSFQAGSVVWVPLTARLAND